MFQDQQGQIDLNPSIILEKLDSWLDGFMKLLPNLIVASIMIVLGYFFAKWIGRLVNRLVSSRDRKNLGEMLGGLVKWALFIMIFSMAATVILPSLSPGDLIAGLGVSSVAIGFAFKDILQNWLAGLLILLRQPFEIGDQIAVNDYEGTVEKIETRATIIKTYSGANIVVPNSEIYTNSVQVNTAHDIIRSYYDVGIGYADDIEEAKKVILDAVSKVEGINKDKGVEVLSWGLDASWVTLRVRWWTKSQRSSITHTRSKVLDAIKLACDDAAIDMPYDTKVHLFHDQTEDTDGDRSQQREGWPLPKEMKNTVPRAKAGQAEPKANQSEQA